MQASRRGTDRANTRLYSLDPLPPVRTKKRLVPRLERLEERTLLSTYNIGPGQPYTTLGSFNWSSLQPGDTVDIHWQSTPYREKLMISESGTASAPINIVGVPGPNGQQPIIDGQNATTSSQFDYSYNPMQENSLICIYHSANQPGTYSPSYINISGLELEGAYSGTNDGGPYTFTDSHGTVQDYADFAAAIYANGVRNLTVQNCTIHDNGLGIFVNTNTDNGANQSANILVQGNYIYDNGIVGSDTEHNTYIESNGVTYQYNYYGPTRSGSSGSELKDRSAGCVIRYNYFAPTQGGHILDLVDSENAHDLAALPSYANTFVYGNVIDNNIVRYPGEITTTPIHFGYDNDPDMPRTNLYFYDNTVLNVIDQSSQWYTELFEMPTNSQYLYAANNIFYNGPATQGGTPSDLCWAQNSGTFVFSPTNWASQGWYDSYDTEHGNSFQGVISGTNTFLSPANNNPGFVNLSGGNYQLATGSSAIGAAGTIPSSWTTATGWPGFATEEFIPPSTFYGGTGTARTSTVDIGAYQAGPGTPTAPTPVPPTPVPVVTISSVQQVLKIKNRRVVTQVLITFSGAINAGEAHLLRFYRLTVAGKDGSFTARNARAVPLKSAVYDTANKSVTLTSSEPFSLAKPLQLIIFGKPPSGLKDDLSRFIDGGTNVVAILSRSGVTITQ